MNVTQAYGSCQQNKNPKHFLTLWSLLLPLKTFSPYLVALVVFSGTASSECICKISSSETLAKREFTPAILFLFSRSRITHYPLARR